ncbi:hypothetical protein [Ectobacillus polymachus]|uniref:hypothetical protein n=1 Tax=Ectobacillus polymachus TaxID=1508806 RepID=UPI003A8575F7
MPIKMNEQGLIYLDARMINAIFDCVYDFDEKGYGIKPDTKKLLKDEQFKYFIQMVKAIQEYNYRFRFGPTSELFPLFESTVGPMERNSDGTTLWLAMGLAIKELYGFRSKTLKDLLKTVNIKK